MHTVPRQHPSFKALAEALKVDEEAAGNSRRDPASLHKPELGLNFSSR